MSATIILRVAS